MIDAKHTAICPSGAAASGDRFAAAESMLLKMRVDTPEPCWSSYSLQHDIASTLSQPGARLDDILRPLAALIGISDIALSETLSNFLRQFVVECFTQHRCQYDQIDWPAFLESIGKTPTQAQCYLALLAVPADKMPFDLAETIVTRLKGTQVEAESASLCTRLPIKLKL